MRATTRETPRFTTVHSRYHVGGNYSGMIEGEKSFADALHTARRAAAAGEDVTIYDSMARRGAVQLWRIVDGVAIEQQRRMR